MSIQFEGSRRLIQAELLKEQLQEWGVQLGAPALTYSAYREADVLTVPNNPYVFYSKKLHLLDEQEEIVSEIDGAMVMLAHGIRTGQEEHDWCFLGTGKSISETVKAYEQAAKSLNAPPLDAIVACRCEDKSVQKLSGEVRFVFSFRMKGFPYIYPVSTAYILNNANYKANFFPGEGAEMAVKTKKWSGIKRWEEFWDRHRDRRQNYTIPNWAKLRAKSQKD